MIVYESSLKKTNEIDIYLKFLPENIARAISFTDNEIKQNITEIRLRVNSPLSLTVNKENILINSYGKRSDIKNCIYTSREEFDYCVNNFCDGSYHAQANNIKNGFIITKDGSRVGVCGNIIYANNSGIDFIVDEITSVNIRINRFVYFNNCPLINLIKENGICSILIYSPPGEGKTTLLRFLSAALSKGLCGLKKYRTALVDEKREVYIKNKMDGGLLDVLYGYKKADGIDCATRTLNPDVVMCDEIGGLEDTNSILSAQNSGVPLIATCHAGDFEQLKRKPNINLLIQNDVFLYFAGITLDKNNIIKYNIYRQL
ncbi:MAG: Flp pilus assembly complex ATPase component TadA [Oscillospiraceae bacterium]|nr:Flp pilus assembly complex ATPase component TadA [Oscillospiraceae bacterium]